MLEDFDSMEKHKKQQTRNPNDKLLQIFFIKCTHKRHKWEFMSTSTPEEN